MKPGTGAPAARPRTRRGRSGRVLVIIAGLMMASGVVRLADGTGMAIARELGSLVTAASASPPRAEENDTTGLEALLAAVRAREARVAEAEARLAERSRALEVAGAEVERRLAALEEAERDLSDLLTLADTAADEDVARLTAMYEAMKPVNAAALFDQMDPAFAAGFLGRMRADAAAQILANLPPDKAYALSVVLAGRNAAAKAEDG